MNPRDPEDETGAWEKLIAFLVALVQFLGLVVSYFIGMLFLGLASLICFGLFLLPFYLVGIVWRWLFS